MCSGYIAAMAEPQPPIFRLLTETEYNALTTAEKVAYLKRAVEAQKALSEQIARGLAQIKLPGDKKDG